MLCLWMLLNSVEVTPDFISSPAIWHTMGSAMHRYWWTNGKHSRGNMVVWWKTKATIGAFSVPRSSEGICGNGPATEWSVWGMRKPLKYQGLCHFSKGSTEKQNGDSNWRYSPRIRGKALHHTTPRNTRGCHVFYCWKPHCLWQDFISLVNVNRL